MEAIVDPGREFLLGRQPIIDLRDKAFGGAAEIAAHPVMRVEAAQDKAAAVKEHEERIGTRRPRAVGPQDYRAT